MSVSEPRSNTVPMVCHTFFETPYQRCIIARLHSASSKQTIECTLQDTTALIERFEYFIMQCAQITDRASDPCNHQHSRFDASSDISECRQAEWLISRHIPSDLGCFAFLLTSITQGFHQNAQYLATSVVNHDCQKRQCHCLHTAIHNCRRLPLTKPFPHV